MKTIKRINVRVKSNSSKITREVSNKDLSSEFLKTSISLIFKLIEWVLYLLAIALVISLFVFLRGNSINPETILVSIFIVFIAVLAFIFGIVCNKVAKAIDRESDRNYIVGYSSAIVSLVALIISLIGILK